MHLIHCDSKQIVAVTLFLSVTKKTNALIVKGLT